MGTVLYIERVSKCVEGKCIGRTGGRGTEI